MGDQNWGLVKKQFSSPAPGTAELFNAPILFFRMLSGIDTTSHSPYEQDGSFYEPKENYGAKRN
jgi:hypothetical protein